MKPISRKRPLWKKVLKVSGITLLILLLVFGGLLVYACYAYREQPAESYYLSELPLTRDRFDADFEEIHHTVVENYSLYRRKGIDMDSLYRVYAGRVARAETTTDYGLLVREYIAALQAGHASTPFALYTAGDYPVVIHDSLFVNHPNSYLLQSGFRNKDRIVAIDDIPVLQWAEEQEKYTSASTPAYRHNQALRSAFRSLTDSIRRYTVVRGEDTLYINLKLKRNEAFPYAAATKTVETKVLHDSIGYIAINTMMPPVLEEFEACYPQVRHLPYLIIDVRANEGGNSLNGANICKHFIKKTQPHCVSQDYVMQPDSDAYQGRIFLLTSPCTFSAAESFTIDMKESGNAVLVGEPTAGDTGNRPRNFSTSHGTWFRIPTRESRQSPQGFPMEGVGIRPHYVVHQTVDDFLQDRDTQLEYVLRMIFTHSACTHRPLH